MEPVLFWSLLGGTAAVLFFIMVFLLARCLLSMAQKKRKKNEENAINVCMPLTQPYVGATATSGQKIVSPFFNTDPDVSCTGNSETWETGSITSFTELESSMNDNGFDAQLGAIRPDIGMSQDTGALGQLLIQVHYSSQASELLVYLMEAQGIPAASAYNVSNNIHITVSLQPQQNHQPFHTSIRAAPNYVIDQLFRFTVDSMSFQERALVFYVFDGDGVSPGATVGKAEVELSGLDLSSGVELCCDLQPQIASDHGEILISLSFQPTAEHLTVVVLKSRNLSPLGTEGSCDPFVEVSLVIDQKKLKKKSTSVRRNTLKPVWNEALVFNVPMEMLKQVNLEVVVLDHDLVGPGQVLGQVRLGKNAPSEGATHWETMMQSLRRSTARWHRLEHGT